MKSVLIAISAGIALSGALCACATYGGPPPHGYYDEAGFNAYYDDAYGPFYDGYWDGPDFFYATGRGQPFARDEGHHFQHAAASGFHGVHGQVHAASHNRG